MENQTAIFEHVSTQDKICKDWCNKYHRCGIEIYVGIAVTSAFCLLLAALAISFYCLYKSERKRRLTMWNVKSEDISVDKIHWNCHNPSKLSNFNPDIIDDVTQSANKRAKRPYTTTGYYKGSLVAVQQFRARRMSLETDRLFDLDKIFRINHEHICKFYGANHNGCHVTVLTEYCTRGSLHDLLKDQMEWDDVFKHSLIFDIVKGMLHLHETSIGSHGNLKPSNCLIDSRFMVKITDFGIIGQRFKVKKKSSEEEKQDPYRKKLWTAPELLRTINPPLEGTKKGDVYSFAIIAQEILFQRGVFYRREEDYSAEDIIQKVTYPSSKKDVFRPSLEDDDDIIIREQWRKTLKKCWAEKPGDRIDFHGIFEVAVGLQTDNTLIDSLIQRLQKYSIRLEEKVEEKTEQYKAEKERSDSLLYQMLPQTVANRLKINTDVMPESYSSVTLYFSDIVGFSAICHDSQPLEVVQMLNDLYTMFDQIIDEFDVYKVETIGDAYMVVSGLPIRNGNNHAREIARMALRLRKSVCNDFVISHMPNVTLKLRIGIHTGPVVAGVVGLKMPRYCLFGDTVNTAARMEQSGKELKIHISPHTKEVLDDFGTFDLKKRKQSVTLKGLGEWNTWWLLGEKCSTFQPESQAGVVDIYVPPGPGRVPKQSVSSTISSSSSDTTLLCDRSDDYNFETTYVVEEETAKRKYAETLPMLENRQRSQSYVIPARYRPSCHAKMSKQRRNGSAMPLLVIQSNDHNATSDTFQCKQYSRSRDPLRLLTPTEEYSSIGALFKH